MKYVPSIERLSREEGREEGHKEGHKEGLLNGLRMAALTQLEAKYGPLDTSIRSLVKKASQDQVLAWMKRILTASSLDEVLAT